MSLRTRLLFVFVLLGLAPLLLVCALNYVSGVRAVEALLRGRAVDRVERIAHGVEQTLKEQEDVWKGQAGAPSLRLYVRDAQASDEARKNVPGLVHAHQTAFFSAGSEFLESVACVGAAGQPLFRLSMAGKGVHFQTDNFASSAPLPYGELVRGVAGGQTVYSPIRWEPGSPHGAKLLVTAPVISEPGSGVVTGALVVEIKLRKVIENADKSEADTAPGDANTRHLAVALDTNAGSFVYSTNSGAEHDKVENTMPHFAPVAARMSREESGEENFKGPPDEHLWVAAFRRVKDLPLSLAVAEDFTAASAGVRRAALWGAALSLAAAAAALALVWFFVGREARKIERVARGAAAIAGGDLAQHIDLTSSGETRQLATAFNRMSDQLREMVAREALTKQFESFMRLSAMLSHDLKNAITGLSMLVSNMERQFHREEFRAEAIDSLKYATDKLRRLVARLSEPVKSLSGEYRRDSRPTDLVPVIRRVLEANAEARAGLCRVVTRLPDSLVATVEPERIENVAENLVINAVEAMSPAGGTLTVEAGEEDGGQLVFFSVADTGPGMDEEFKRTKLFRPFSTTKANGIGLGLYTCKEIVETHGGRLEVESQPGAGTRFRVVLPSRLVTSGDGRRRPPKGSAADASGPGA